MAIWFVGPIRYSRFGMQVAVERLSQAQQGSEGLPNEAGGGQLGPQAAQLLLFLTACADTSICTASSAFTLKLQTTISTTLLGCINSCWLYDHPVQLLLECEQEAWHV